MSGAAMGLIGTSAPKQLSLTLSVTTALFFAPGGAHNFGNNTATATGGVGSYAYTWAITNQIGSGTWSASPTNAALTTVSVFGVAPGASSQITLTCTVKDAASNTAQATANYTIDNTGGNL